MAFTTSYTILNDDDNVKLTPLRANSFTDNFVGGVSPLTVGPQPGSGVITVGGNPFDPNGGGGGAIGIYEPSITVPWQPFDHFPIGPYQHEPLTAPSPNIAVDFRDALIDELKAEIARLSEQAKFDEFLEAALERFRVEFIEREYAAHYRVA